MQKLALILIVLCCLTSCKSTKSVSNHSKTTPGHALNKNEDKRANAVVEHAHSFDGVKYRYGGVSRKGMDCSGLVWVSFKKEDVLLPRVSRDMAKRGTSITLNEVKKGDLLFFQTDKNKNVINHVGLVVNSGGNRIEFIHSTTSKGVITSTLKEPYWYNSFIEARRIL